MSASLASCHRGRVLVRLHRHFSGAEEYERVVLTNYTSRFRHSMMNKCHSLCVWNSSKRINRPKNPGFFASLWTKITVYNGLL